MVPESYKKFKKLGLTQLPWDFISNNHLVMTYFLKEGEANVWEDNGMFDIVTVDINNWNVYIFFRVSRSHEVRENVVGLFETGGKKKIIFKFEIADGW